VTVASLGFRIIFNNRWKMLIRHRRLANRSSVHVLPHYANSRPKYDTDSNLENFEL